MPEHSANPDPPPGAHMKNYLSLAIALALVSTSTWADTAVTYFPAAASGVPAGAGATPPFSSAVLAGDTLYVAGTTDGGAPDAKAGAKVVMDNIKTAVEKAGFTMDELVWVQVFATDLANYAVFNEAYRTYFKGPNLPARAFVGAGSLLGGAHFEVMGIAVKRKK
jgi:2-iminobutanoate/2-iminopropanoate deaminase